MGDALFGLVGDGFVMLAADRMAARSVVVFNDYQDKLFKINDHSLMAASGPVGDRTHFCEFVQKNIALYELRNEVSMSTHALARWTRNQMATALRKNPYQVNLLIGGYDKGKGEEKGKAAMYYMDYMGSVHPMPYAAHGYGAYFTLSIMDKYCKKNMTEAEALEVMRKCIGALAKRFVLNMPKFIVKVVDANGIRVVEL